MKLNNLLLTVPLATLATSSVLPPDYLARRDTGVDLTERGYQPPTDCKPWPEKPHHHPSKPKPKPKPKH